MYDVVPSDCNRYALVRSIPPSPHHPSATALNDGGTRSVSKCRYGAVSFHCTAYTLDSCTPHALTVFRDSGFFSYRCGASPSHCNGYSVAIGPEISDRRHEEKYLWVCVSSQWCRLLQEEQVCSGPVGPKHSDQTQQEKADCITVTVLASSIATLVFWTSGTRVLL